MTVLKAENLGKAFRLYGKPFHRMLDIAGLAVTKTFRQFWALKGISFELGKGQVAGIIGDNGAGKSTLLRILTGISRPSEGSYHISGRAAALLAVGAGFHPEFTGRDNIRMTCSVQGVNPAEIEEKTEEIIGFAEIGDFIDQPVKTYSSGMFTRLGFSAAANTDPDVLIVDEALSVGDEYFQRKSIEKIKSFLTAGGTMVFVSHSLHLVKSLSTKVIWLKDGRIEEQGPPDTVTGRYIDYVRSREGKAKDNGHSGALRGDGRYGTGSGEVTITGVKILDAAGSEKGCFETGEELVVEVSYKCHKPVGSPVFGIAIFRNDGVYCYGPNTFFDGVRTGTFSGEGRFRIRYKSIPLLAGSYAVSAAVFDSEHVYPYDWHHALYPFKVETRKPDHGLVYIPHTWEIDDVGEGFIPSQCRGGVHPLPGPRFPGG